MYNSLIGVHILPVAQATSFTYLCTLKAELCSEAMINLFACMKAEFLGAKEFLFLG